MITALLGPALISPPPAASARLVERDVALAPAPSGAELEVAGATARLAAGVAGVLEAIVVALAPAPAAPAPGLPRRLLTARLGDVARPSASALPAGRAMTRAVRNAASFGTGRAALRRSLLALGDQPADRPRAMLAAIRTARALGCRVTQNPAVGDPMRGSHVSGSKHYQHYPGTGIGRAIDVYCTHATMLRYFRWAEQHRHAIFLDDLFFDPVGYSYDAGREWGVVIGGHSDHVHLSI